MVDALATRGDRASAPRTLARPALGAIAVMLALACRSEPSETAERAGRSAPSVTAPRPETRMRTFQIEYFAKPHLPRVTVTAEIPAAWTETLSAGGAPSFAVPGKTGTPPAITALGLEQPDVAARIERAMALQYGERLDGVVRTQLDGGRVWAVREEQAFHHARMFLPARHGVVMAVALVRHAEADRLAEIEAVYRTVHVEGP